MYLKSCTLDFDRAEVIRDKEHIALTAKEFDLLQVLSRNAGRIVTIDMLCEAVWGDNPLDMKIPLWPISGGYGKKSRRIHPNRNLF